jgi:hypothetical protein
MAIKGAAAASDGTRPKSKLQKLPPDARVIASFVLFGASAHFTAKSTNVCRIWARVMPEKSGCTGWEE